MSPDPKHERTTGHIPPMSPPRVDAIHSRATHARRHIARRDSREHARGRRRRRFQFERCPLLRARRRARGRAGAMDGDPRPGKKFPHPWVSRARRRCVEVEGGWKRWWNIFSRSCAREGWRGGRRRAGDARRSWIFRTRYGEVERRAQSDERRAMSERLTSERAARWTQDTWCTESSDDRRRTITRDWNTSWNRDTRTGKISFCTTAT